MYGTVAHMKVKPGQADALLALQDEWDRGRQPKGFLGEYVYRLDKDSDEFILVVLFEDKESYFANAQDPEQDKEFRQLRELLVDDPHWHDGEVVHSFLK